MSVNKFGASAESTDIGSSLEFVRASIHSLRAFVRDNALCIDSSAYDAKDFKIRRLAVPEAADDAVNKQYVKILVDEL